ncbi:DUF5133 domain-containing protein [Streptomyces sp. MBT62]|uniref:DUF5133 domain-containing protein n=1 Tax=Streptomyces sp. MBT62 TaxID=2800410 RepID=UPI00190B2433|nr:DUF5133 domain-containing protein [Streptomyces sp. MBT62]MBK3564850.1 DUF5133 domain-containing protein [Streptomyces sp. MBT62]
MVPAPAVLRRALDRYLALSADEDPAAAVAVQNAAYTLCVLTGTRTVEEAMSTADLLDARRMGPAPSSPRTFIASTVELGSGRTGAVS